MEAIVIILFIAVLGGLTWCGNALREHILENYDYNIFSGVNIAMGCASIIFLIFSWYVYGESKAMTLNVVVLIGVAVLLYAAMFIMHLQKLNVSMAVLSILYQIILSSVIVFVIIIVILYFLTRSAKKD